MMCDEYDPILFDPDVVSPACQEVLISYEKAILSLPHESVALKCAGCGRTIGYAVQRESDADLVKTPVFCDPYPCLYSWSKKQTDEASFETEGEETYDGWTGINESSGAEGSVNSGNEEQCHTGSSPHDVQTTPNGLSQFKKTEENGSDIKGKSDPTQTAVNSAILTTPSHSVQAFKRFEGNFVNTAVLRYEGSFHIKPSSWLSEVLPQRSPYLPQLGDELVYFRQGHELYMRQVTTCNIYPMTKRMLMSLPYMQDPNLPPEVSVRVVKMNVTHLAHLELERTDWETGQLSGAIFHVHYHHLPSVPDFLVLRQIYDKSLKHQWQAGERCIMDKTWRLGAVMERKPLNLDYPDSAFQSYSIKWDLDDEQQPEQLSPWDMEIIPDAFDAKNGDPATEEEIRKNCYVVIPEDWERYGDQVTVCKKISCHLEPAMNNVPIAEPSFTRVDTNLQADVHQVTYPVDLSTIKARLNNSFYRRPKAIVLDLQLIAINADRFSQQRSVYVELSRLIKDLLKKMAREKNTGSLTLQTVLTPQRSHGMILRQLLRSRRCVTIKPA